MPSINGLATTSALTKVENKIPDEKKQQIKTQKYQTYKVNTCK